MMTATMMGWRSSFGGSRASISWGLGWKGLNKIIEGKALGACELQAMGIIIFFFVFLL